MLDSYFCAPKTLRRVRDDPSAPYVDGFADLLERDGYARSSAVHTATVIDWASRAPSSAQRRTRY